MLTSERVGAVLRLTMDRPRRRNALGEEAIGKLRQALLEADRDASVRAVVLTGSAPAFCAGSDLKELGGMTIEQMCRHEADTAEVGRLISGLDKPVIAAVEGYALGGGFILAISCDVVVSARDARWHLPEVANGWLPPWGLQTLAARVGVTRARQLTWGADSMDGVEAFRQGVADHLTGTQESVPVAMALAARLAALPPVAVAGTKRFFEMFATVDGERMDKLASRMFAEHCEGPAAQAVLARFASSVNNTTEKQA